MSAATGEFGSGAESLVSLMVVSATKSEFSTSPSACIESSFVSEDVTGTGSFQVTTGGCAAGETGVVTSIGEVEGRITVT